MKKFVAVGLAMLLLLFVGASLAAADTLGFSVQGGIVDLGSPAYDWWYGCAPTSAGMMMGYYEQNGYAGNSFSNLVPGMTAGDTGSSGWGSAINNIIASQGYVNDFYRYYNLTTGTYTAALSNGGSSTGYGVSGDDITGSLRAYNCLADFMGSGQDAAGNANGTTTFYYWTSGAKFYAKDAAALGVGSKDGMYGMDEYFRYCGYGQGIITNDTSFYTQLIYSSNAPQGFSFADYKKEIDSGRVVMIQLNGHSMEGYGYKDDPTGQWILFHNTWDDGEHEMLWGGTYDNMAQWGVVCFDPGEGAVPVPGSVWLLASGLLALLVTRLRWRKTAV